MSKLRKALQRAKDASERTVPSRSVERKVIARPFTKEAKTIAHPVLERDEIKITYSKTKVQKVDPEILRKNKILSLFKANKTTDQVEGLRTQLLTKLKEINGNSILVTSVHPGEGKTFTSINLGVSIAQQLDRTVLLIDADLRDPWKNHYDFSLDFWGIKTEKGLSDYLMENASIEELLVNPGIDKLTILPGGKPVPNSAELLASKRMEQFVRDVKQRYGSNRICIFDCPAILRYTDPLVFAHLIDGVLLVLEAERTTPEELKKAIGLFKDCTILGMVFNKSKDVLKND
jgi:non-specific protein-tyrosine kinase